MKRIFYLLKQSLFVKLTLVVTLLIGGGNSVWAQKSLPYSYGFEENFSTEGWTLVDCYNASYVSTYNGTGLYALSSGKYDDGSYAIRFYPNADYRAQCLITPELESSATGLEVSFHYRSAYGSTPTQTFQVGYSTTNTSSFTWGDEMSYQSTSWVTYNAIFPAGTKYIAVKYTNITTGNYLYLDAFDISAINPYKTPTGFALDSYTGTSATFNWTAGNSETAWQFAYSTNSDFTPGTDGTTLDITENPYTLSGLTTGTPYYAAIRADYGDGNYSEWTEKISFTPKNEIETVVNDGNDANGYTPFYSSATNNGIENQFIIPESSLTAIVNRQITKMTFYRSSSTSASFGNAEFEVYLKNTSNTSFSSTTLESWGANVYNSASLSVNSNGEMIIEFDTPFNYTGGNLMVGFKQTVVGSGTYLSWYGVNTSTNTALSILNTISGNKSANNYKFLPKVTITSTTIESAPVKIDDNGYTTFASTYPLDLTSTNLPCGLKAYKANIVEGNKVKFTEINQTVPANTGILLAGTTGETYFIPVAESGTALGDNLLLVNADGGTFTAEIGYTYYGMLKNSDPLTFGTFDPNSVAIPSNKAYLKVADTGEARTLTCSFFDETTTGIMETRTEGIDRLTTTKVYNLAGQQIANPTKGLYIINGKKHIIK